MDVSSQSHLLEHKEHPLQKRPGERKKRQNELREIVAEFHNMWKDCNMQWNHDYDKQRTVFSCASLSVLSLWYSIGHLYKPMITGAVLHRCANIKSRHWYRYLDWLGFSLRGVALRRSLSRYITSLQRHACTHHIQGESKVTKHPFISEIKGKKITSEYLRK